MKVLLDSNFIISCVKKKIDFVEELKNLGFHVAIPREVMQELKDLKLKLTHDDRSAIDIAMQIIEKGEIEKMTIGSRNVDEGLIEKGRKGFYIATLDAAIKRTIPNRITINAAKNNIQVERD